MEEVDIWDHFEKYIVASTDSMKLTSHNKKEAKEKRIILDSMKDHYIPHIAKEH